MLATRIGGRDNKAHSVTLGENYVISSSTLNAVRFAYNRTHISRPDIDFFSAPEVGINSYSYLPHYMLLTVTGGFMLGDRHRDADRHRHARLADQRRPDAGARRPSVRVRRELRALELRSRTETSARPASSPSTAPSPDSVWPDFLLGKMGTNALVQAAPNTLDMQQTYIGLYAQDTWRVGPRLTLNYGMRWEPFFPQQLRNGAVYQFDMARFQAGTKSTVFPNAPAGLYFPGDPSFPTQAGMLTDWNNFGPRVGVAWDPMGDGKTSVRASYGKSYEFVNGQFHLNTSVAPPWGSEVRLNAPPGGLDNPFLGSPGGQTNIFPVTFDQNAAFSLNGPFLSLTNDLADHQRALLQRDGRAAAERPVVCDGRLRRQQDGQHLGVHATQQRALHPGSRHQCRAKHRQHQ